MAATKILLRILVLALACSSVFAAVLPEDRSDAMYHAYNGGGLEVEGPSVLVRKAYKDKFSVWANYYVDYVTSASIDVVTTASPYDEQRDEYSVGVDYLFGKTSMGVSYTNSEESDYEANTVGFSISQPFFGDLTTLAIAYRRGWDDVYRNEDDAFAEEADHQSFRVDLSQIITKNFIVSLNYEGVVDEGFLNNPYRSVRYLDPSSPAGFSYQLEEYPDTRTSSATSIRGMYYLPMDAALKTEFRYYTDTWDIDAWNAEVALTQRLPKGILMEAKYRYYDQTAAEFYSDLFPRADFQNYMARDKELSTFTSHTVGAGVSWKFPFDRVSFFTEGEFSLFVDYMLFEYDDFRDVRGGGAPGTEPLYDFDAVVTRAFFTLRY